MQLVSHHDLRRARYFLVVGSLLLTGCSGIIDPQKQAPPDTSNPTNTPDAGNMSMPNDVARGTPRRNPACAWFGILPGFTGNSLSELDTFEAVAKRPFDLIGYYQGWADRAPFNSTFATAVANRGATPVITWEPYDWQAGTDQSNFQLAKIIDGTHDEHIRQFAKDIALFARPVFLRFAHEMNGDWMSWSELTNQNKPGEYIKAWRHVHDLFQEAGAKNVTWVWSPNVVSEKYIPLAQIYPGDTYVDWVAMDGYNWGTAATTWTSTWLSPSALFDATLAELRKLTNKPIMIAETASTETGGDKAGWIRELPRFLERNPDISGLMWFEYNKETDWRSTSSPEAQKAFAEMATDPIFCGNKPSDTKTSICDSRKSLFCHTLDQPSYALNAANTGTLSTSTRAYRGAGSLLASVPPGGSKRASIEAKLTPINEGDVYIRAYVKVLSSQPLKQFDLFVLRVPPTTQTPEKHCALALQTAGVSVWCSGAANYGTILQSAAPIVTDQWMCVEWRLQVAPSGLTSVSINGTAIASSPGQTHLGAPFQLLHGGIDYTAPDQGALSVKVDELVVDTKPIGCDAP